MKKKGSTVVIALAFTGAVILLGYIMLGLLPAFLFTFGFLGGFILWLLIPVQPSFQAIRLPYLITLALFVLHKLEERYMNFFPRLSEITGVPVPDSDSPLVYLLYAFACAWLFIPFLLKRGYNFGTYLTWTFFTAMGVTELAHFVFPFLKQGPYGYFPGMISVILLAPAAWWGMYRLVKEQKKVQKG